MDDGLLRPLLRPWRQLLPAQQCRHCRAVAAEGSLPLCDPCRQQLWQSLSVPRCYRCALPLPLPEADQQPASDSGVLLCGECLSVPPAFHRSVCGGDYQPPFSGWLRQFKDQRDLRDGRLLCRRLEQTLRHAYQTDSWPQWLLPVPLHWRRQLRRSFNQSAWLAKQLQAQLGIPARAALRRRRAGSDQRQLGRRQRQRSLHRVFDLAPGHHSSLQGAHVALVDDVVTTTATVRALSRELLRQGVARVDVWCLCRTGKPDY